MVVCLFVWWERATEVGDSKTITSGGVGIRAACFEMTPDDGRPWQLEEAGGRDRAREPKGR